jgi:hypothetical protein
MRFTEDDSGSTPSFLSGAMVLRLHRCAGSRYYRRLTDLRGTLSPMYHSNRLASLLCVLCVVCAVTAHVATAAPAGDACALLTPAQVGAAMGVSVGAGSYITATFKRTCTWTTTGGGYVTLMLQDVGGLAGGKQLGRLGLKNTSVTALSSVGDDAYYLAAGGQVGLILKKGNAVFKIALYAPIPVERKKAKEKALAKRVVATL